MVSCDAGCCDVNCLILAAAATFASTVEVEEVTAVFKLPDPSSPLRSCTVAKCTTTCAPLSLPGLADPSSSWSLLAAALARAALAAVVRAVTAALATWVLPTFLVSLSAGEVRCCACWLRRYSRFLSWRRRYLRRKRRRVNASSQGEGGRGKGKGVDRWEDDTFGQYS